eukprot:g3199.t1
MDSKHEGREEEAEKEGKEAEPQQRRKRVLRKGMGPRVNALVVMESVLEKLKLLDYEEHFCAKKSKQPFTRTIFAVTPPPPENPGTLLALFLKVVAWLMGLNNREFILDKYDDPTTSVNKLMVDLKQMGFKMDFPALKLRQGFGDAVCIVLNFLCDRALEVKGFAFKGHAPVYPDEFDDEAKVDEEADIGMIEDDIAESSEEEVMYSQMVQQQRSKNAATKEKSPKKMLLETNTDAIKWNAELERVSSKLSKLSRIGASVAEWRTHLEVVQTNGSVVTSDFPKVQTALKSIGDSIKLTVERIASKEKYINSKFDSMQYQFRELQQKYDESQRRHQTTQESVRDLSETLSTVSARLDELKELQESKGSSMTDTGPLIRMKKALKKLQSEMKEMEIRIGVLSHTLMQAKMEEKGEEMADDDDIDDGARSGIIKRRDDDDDDDDDDGDEF